MKWNWNEIADEMNDGLFAAVEAYKEGWRNLWKVFKRCLVRLFDDLGLGG